MLDFLSVSRCGSFYFFCSNFVIIFLGARKRRWYDWISYSILRINWRSLGRVVFRLETFIQVINLFFKYYVKLLESEKTDCSVAVMVNVIICVFNVFQNYHIILVYLLNGLHDSLYSRFDVRKPSAGVFNCVFFGVSVVDR